MAKYFAQCIVRSTTGSSRDDWVSTFAAGGIPDLDLTYATNWVNQIKLFFDACKANTAMKGRAIGGHLVKIYDIDNPQPNYPKWELPWTFGSAVGSVELPEEVQLCVSYINTPATTVPRARRRGRLYIGGWASSSNVTARPVAARVTQLANDYLAYVQGFNALGGLDAGVWSRVNNQVYPVDTMYVDNEWDTMRSRGLRSTARTTVILP